MRVWIDIFPLKFVYKQNTVLKVLIINTSARLFICWHWLGMKFMLVLSDSDGKIIYVIRMLIWDFISLPLLSAHKSAEIGYI